jgi:hypothetical protein
MRSLPCMHERRLLLWCVLCLAEGDSGLCMSCAPENQGVSERGTRRGLMSKVGSLLNQHPSAAMSAAVTTRAAVARCRQGSCCRSCSSCSHTHLCLLKQTLSIVEVGVSTLRCLRAIGLIPDLEYLPKQLNSGLKVAVPQLHGLRVSK